jgi:di/tricarboxylate transporter
VLGLLKGLALCACIVWLFPDKAERSIEVEPTRPLSPEEKRLGVLLLITLGLWLTDSLHGISPAWVGLAAACLCLLPRIGFVSGEEFGQEVNHRTAVYVAAILGLAALVGQSGLGTLIGNEVLTIAPLDPASPFRSYASIVGLSTLLNFVVTANGVPALFTPLAQSLATASGFPLLSVLMIQVIGFSTPLLPYQASPIVLAIEMGRIPFVAALRLSLALAFITFVVLVPINYGWFVFLGWLP